jgi:predicted MFS family arabinose efflux permease
VADRDSTGRVLAGGMLAMALGVGMARFAYTPLLPLMQAEAGFGAATAGWLAAANYAGYLVGALWASRLGSDEGRHRLLNGGLAASVATMALMPLAASPPLWALWRFVAGLAGAWVFVLASALVVPALTERGRAGLVGWHFGGVGLGIAISGLVVDRVAPLGGSAAGWWSLAALGAAFAWLSWHGLAGLHGAASSAASPPAPARPPTFPLALLAAAYACEGFGYIVTGTFLVALIRASERLAPLGNMAWVLVGLAALPSSALWAVAAARLGFVPVLIAAHLLQAVGIALPALSGHPAAVLASALLFGGTFLGIAGVSLAFARTLTPRAPARTIGWLTAVYGIGQMAGPVVAGLLAGAGGSFAPALLLAAAAVAAGAALLAVGARQSSLTTTT